MQGRPRRNDESGAVLIVVLMVMLTLLGVGVMTLWLTQANLQVGGAVNLRTQAFYAAEAGIERAAATLNGEVAPDLDALLRGSNAGIDNVPTALDASGMPNGVGAIVVDRATPLNNVNFPPVSFGRSPGVPDRPVAEFMGRYTVWIRNDLAEARLIPPKFVVDDNNTVILRSRGVANDGRTNVVLEVTMIPSGIMGGDPGAAGATAPADCISGKNACDDNSNTQYGLSFGN